MYSATEDNLSVQGFHLKTLLALNSHAFCVGKTQLLDIICAISATLLSECIVRVSRCEQDPHDIVTPKRDVTLTH